MKFCTKNFESIAKSTGKVERYKYANVKALVEAEEEKYGKCLYKDCHPVFSTEYKQKYCQFTYEPAEYHDQRTGIWYNTSSAYPIIDNLDRGDILTFEYLQKIYDELK